MKKTGLIGWIAAALVCGAFAERFSFCVDTENRLGVWGIDMQRDLTVSPFPYMECRIEGRTVYIDSEGTRALTIDLGPEGLQMEGDFTVIWI